MLKDAKNHPEETSTSAKVAVVRGRIISTSRELSDGDRQSWAALAARAIEPNPFHEPECVLAAARNLPQAEHARIAVAEDANGKVVACLPYQHVGFGSDSLSAISYKLATSRLRRMNYLGTPLIDPAGGLDATVALLETVAEDCRSEGSYAIDLWDVAADGPADVYLREAAASLGFRLILVDSFDRGILKRGEAVEEEPGHSKRTMRNLRSKQRSLGRALGADVVLVDRSDDAAIEEYIRMEASGYKSETGVAMGTVPGEPEFFTEMCKSFAAEGRLHFLSLMAGSTTTAMVAWVDSGDSIFQFKWSYDATLAKYSPGLQIHSASIEHFQESTDAALLDTCTGRNNDFVSAMYPARRTLNRYTFVVQDGLRNRAVVKLVDGIRALRDPYLRRAKRAQSESVKGFRVAGS